MEDKIKKRKIITEEERASYRKLNRLMNQTPILFDLEQFEKEEDVEVRMFQTRLYIKNRFAELYEKEGYCLTLDQIANQFGLTENYIQKNILPHVKHLQSIDGFGNAFKDPDLFPELNFIERRILKFKKCFVNQYSLMQYLAKYLKLVSKTEEGDYIEIPCLEETIKLYFIDRKDKLIRKADVKQIALAEKQSETLRKAEMDLKMLKRVLGIERYTQERKKLLEAKIEDYNITVKDLEVDNYLARTVHERYHLYAPDKTQNPSVLYYFY